MRNLTTSAGVALGAMGGLLVWTLAAVAIFGAVA